MTECTTWYKVVLLLVLCLIVEGKNVDISAIVRTAVLGGNSAVPAGRISDLRFYNVILKDSTSSGKSEAGKSSSSSQGNSLDFTGAANWVVVGKGVDSAVEISSFLVDLVDRANSSQVWCSGNAADKVNLLISDYNSDIGVVTKEKEYQSVLTGCTISYSLKIDVSKTGNAFTDFFNGFDYSWAYTAYKYLITAYMTTEYLIVLGTYLGICIFLPGIDLKIQGRMKRENKVLIKAYFGNVYWLLFGGILNFLIYMILALFFILTFAFYPIGIHLLKNSMLYLLPYGRTLVKQEGYGDETWTKILAGVWFIPIGILLGIYHAIAVFACAVSLIFIPHLFQHLKHLILVIRIFKRKAKVNANLEKINMGNEDNFKFMGRSFELKTKVRPIDAREGEFGENDAGL